MYDLDNDFAGYIFYKSCLKKEKGVYSKSTKLSCYVTERKTVIK